ncbi:MAG: hypothetical protein QW317_11500 [Thermoproteus sp.]
MEYDLPWLPLVSDLSPPEPGQELPWAVVFARRAGCSEMRFSYRPGEGAEIECTKLSPELYRKFIRAPL